MKRISAIILCVLLCASCERHGGNDKDLGNDDNITGAVNSEGFLISYIYPCELDIQRGDADSLKVLIRGDSATDEEKHILMEKYGDTTFNSTLIYNRENETYNFSKRNVQFSHFSCKQNKGV